MNKCWLIVTALGKYLTIFTPWHLGPKGHYRCLRLHVRLAVYPSVTLPSPPDDSSLFELESPNLHQTYIMGYYRLVLKMVVIDFDPQGHFGQLTQKSRKFGFSIRTFNILRRRKYAPVKPDFLHILFSQLWMLPMFPYCRFRWDDVFHNHLRKLEKSWAISSVLPQVSKCHLLSGYRRYGHISSNSQLIHIRRLICIYTLDQSHQQPPCLYR